MPRPNIAEQKNVRTYLQSQGAEISPETSAEALSSLAEWIRRGNTLGAGTIEERVVLLNRESVKWVGKRVAQGSAPNARQGIVRYLLAKPARQVFAVRMGSPRSDFKERVSSPFRAGVLWQGERQIRIAEIESLVLLSGRE